MKSRILNIAVVIAFVGGVIFIAVPKVGCIYPIHYSQAYVVKLHIEDNKIDQFRNEISTLADQANSNFAIKQYPSLLDGEQFTVNHMGYCNFDEYVFTINSFDKNRYDVFMSNNMLFSDQSITTKGRSFVESIKARYTVIEHGTPEI